MIFKRLPERDGQPFSRTLIAIDAQLIVGFPLSRFPLHVAFGRLLTAASYVSGAHRDPVVAAMVMESADAKASAR